MTQNDQLPVYPPNIQGELRLILQNKDLFLLCYKYLEDYRRLSEEQNRIITKDFIEEQIRLGEDEINELRKEHAAAESKLAARLQQNESILGQLSVRGMLNFAENGRRLICRSPMLRRCPKLSLETNIPAMDLTLFENIALAIEEIQREIRDKLKPLCEFLRDLFYLQLHFTLVLTQVCNYCMPLITENIGLIDRIFFWTDRPEFELIRKSGEIADRLKDIYTRTQTVLTLLVENVMFLQNKVELQKNLEKKFQERLEMQQMERDMILRKIHVTRQELDILDEENDRLVGTLVKLDPKYVVTDHFNELADYSVRRNFVEGRLTPEGFHVRQATLSPTSNNPYNLNTPNIRVPQRFSREEILQKLPQKFSREENLPKVPIVNMSDETHNTSNQYDNGPNKRRPNRHRDRKKRHKNYDDQDDKENQQHPRKSKRRESRKHRKSDTEVSNSNMFTVIPQLSKPASIKDKLLQKTKTIFDNAFKKTPLNPTNQKPSNKKDYVKVFEGEILAELNQLSSINNEKPTMNSSNELMGKINKQPPNSWDVSSKSHSLERSLRHKYDIKEAEIFKTNNDQKTMSKLEYFHKTKDN